jgi:exo-beta-1,3-glucanase (GH17 family)
MKNYAFLSLLFMFSHFCTLAKTNDTSDFVRLKWINFSPYILTGQDPDSSPEIPESQIIALLDTIKPYVEGIRTFGTKYGLEKIPYLAKQRGLKVIVEMWIGYDTISNIEQIERGISIAKAGYADKLIVGNDVFSPNYHLPPYKIIEYINKVKQACPNIPVSYADKLSRFKEQPEIGNACDFIAANINPFNEGVSIECAIQRFNQEFNILSDTYPGKEIFVSECGWKMEGTWKYDAEPSLENAKVYIRQLLEWSKAFNHELCIFSAFDEPYKKNKNEYGWGIFDNNAKLKPGMDTIFTLIETIDSTWLKYSINNDSNDTLNIEFVPPIGSLDSLEGHINFLNPLYYQITSYIKVNDKWWIKPTAKNPTVLIQSNGNWRLPYNTGGSDVFATDICLFLVPFNYSPPNCLGCSNIPDSVYKNSISMKYIKRCPLPYDSISVSHAIGCPGDTMTLFTNGGISYLWNTGDTTNSIQVAPTTQTKYSVMVTKMSGCIETREVTINILTSDNIDLIKTICEGDSVRIGNSFFTKTGSYSVKMSNRFGCDSIVNLYLTVDPIHHTPLPASICKGESFQFLDSVFTNSGKYNVIESHGNCKFIWDIDLIVNPTNNTNITKCHGESIKIGDSFFYDPGNYTVNLTNQYNCDSIVNLTINPNPNVYLGNDTTIFNADSILLDAGNGFNTYLWNNGETTQSIQIDKQTCLGENKFSVIVTDNNQCIGSDTITINIITGLNTISMNDNITFYPNPSSGKLYIEIENIRDKNEFQIISEAGQILYSKRYEKLKNNIKEELDLTGYPSGIYFLKVINNNQIKVEKFTLKN